MGTEAWRIPLRPDAYNASSDASLFSTSLPALPHQKYAGHGCQSVDERASLPRVQQDAEDQNSFECADTNFTGSFLPDDEDELLAGIVDDLDLSGLPNQLEELEDDDIFGNGGGMELDFNPREKLIIGMSKVSLSDFPTGNGSNPTGITNGVGAVAGEHPYGEHPSRTLFVRNINSNIDDAEVKELFEEYGDIRTLYTACKHRGFVIISYYDIRAARTAIRALQNKPLRRRKLDIHFSIPKDNPSDKDVNQGTLVVFNLDPAVSNEELHHYFGAYGEVKEIRETPHKRNHKFIEFYDVRAAEAALRCLNRSDIAGKRIKLETSRPGGARRNLMQKMSQDPDQDDTRSFRHQVGSPTANSPPVTGNWVEFSNLFEHHPLQALSQSPVLGSIRANNYLPGLASILPPLGSNSANIAPIGKDSGAVSHVDPVFSNTNSRFQHSRSLPESALNAYPGNMSSYGPSASQGSGVGILSGSQFLWGSSPPYSEHSSSFAWSTSSSTHPFTSIGQAQGIAYSNGHLSFLGLPDHHQQHHVGSAPSGVGVPLDRNLGYFPDSPEISFTNSAFFGGMGLSQNEGNFMMNMGTRTAMRGGLGFLANMLESSPNSWILSSPRPGPGFLGSGPYQGPGTNSIDGLADRGRRRPVESGGNPIESRSQFQLDLDKIVNGEDTRTTLMIKNIPNKYTSKMLLAVIDESHRGTYDFIYLPIDFKNKCNVGYAFINMVAPSHLISFYQAFNGKKWEKFNSEKVALLAYARIQGKVALVAHFQNSSLMNEDKRCRPILFHLEHVECGDQEAFSSNMNIRVRQPNRSFPESTTEEH